MKKLSKKLLIIAAHHLMILNLLRKAGGRCLTVVMYHRFSKSPESFKLQAFMLDRQIRYFKKSCTLLTLAEAMGRIRENPKALPDNCVVLTIDDGYEDNYRIAFPILRKHQVPATIFVATDFIDRQGWLWSNLLEYILTVTPIKKFDFPIGQRREQFYVNTFQNWHVTQLAIFNYCRTIRNEEKDQLLRKLAENLAVEIPETVVPEFKPMNWDQIREMSNCSIEFGSHTCSHPILTSLSEKKQTEEIFQSKAIIETKIGKIVNSFCYPNGQPEDFTAKTVQNVILAGYDSAVTTVYGLNRVADMEPYRMKRITLNHYASSYLSRTMTHIPFLDKE